MRDADVVALAQDVADELDPIVDDEEPEDVANLIEDVFARKLAGLRPLQGHIVAFIAGMMICDKRAPNGPAIDRRPKSGPSR